MHKYNDNRNPSYNYTEYRPIQVAELHRYNYWEAIPETWILPTGIGVLILTLVLQNYSRTPHTLRVIIYGLFLLGLMLFGMQQRFLMFS